MFISAATGSEDGSKHAVIASVPERRGRDGRTAARKSIAVVPGDLVVGSPGFAQRWMRVTRDTGRQASEEEVGEESALDDDDGSDDDAPSPGSDDVGASDCRSAVGE